MYEMFQENNMPDHGAIFDCGMAAKRQWSKQRGERICMAPIQLEKPLLVYPKPKSLRFGVHFRLSAMNRALHVIAQPLQ